MGFLKAYIYKIFIYLIIITFFKFFINCLNHLFGPLSEPIHLKRLDAKKGKIKSWNFSNPLKRFVVRLGDKKYIACAYGAYK